MNQLLLILNTVAAAIKTGQLPQLGFWTYILLALLVAVEGPIATLLGAAAAAAGLLHPWLIFISAAIGNLTADSLWYSLGYLGGTEWIMRFGRRFGLRENLIGHLKQNMLAHADKVLFLSKLTVSFVIPSLVTAGLLRVPWRRWFPALVMAETLWTGSLVLIGYYTTEAVRRVEQGVAYAVMGASILFVVFVLILIVKTRRSWERYV